MINFSELLWKPGRTSTEATSSIVRSPEPSERDGDFARIPTDEAVLKPESRISFYSEPSGVAADRFRYLRMRLRELKELTRLKTIVVTSPLPEDGKTTIVLNLATTLAEGGKRSVLVVEADLHRPSLAKRLGLQERPGLAQCLDSDLNPLSTLRRVEPLNWYLMQAGASPEHSTELIQSEVFPSVMKRLTPYFDWILIDTPPVIPVTDSISISRHADATLVVVRADHTSKDAIEKALALIGPKYVMGIVFNGAGGLGPKYPEYTKYYQKK